MSKDHEYLYPYSAQEAKKRNQLPMWRESYHANVACRNAIEETIRQNFDGMHLKKDCLEPVLAEYGYKRTEWVLATTLQELSWDGRFSRANKQWAARRYIPQDERHNAEITVRSHPAILDGFVDLYREAYQMCGPSSTLCVVRILIVWNTTTPMRGARSSWRTHRRWQSQ